MKYYTNKITNGNKTMIIIESCDDQKYKIISNKNQRTRNYECNTYY